MMFAQSDDVESQSAATGALAMVAHDPEIAKHIAKAWAIEPDKDSKEKDTKDADSKADSKAAPAKEDTTVVTTDQKQLTAADRELAQLYNLNVLQVLYLSPQTHKDVKIRVAAALKHMKAHGLYTGPL
jgi:hypothetical protein